VEAGIGEPGLISGRNAYGCLEESGWLFEGLAAETKENGADWPMSNIEESGRAGG
jgi:hypothetical protein